MAAKKHRWVVWYGLYMRVGSPLWKWVQKNKAEILGTLRKHKPKPKKPVPVPPEPKPKPVVDPLKPVTMYDSVDITKIPKRARAVAGYVGGRWPTYSPLVAAFPKAHVLSIAVASSELAECLDVENGDAAIADAPVWVKQQVKRGVVQPVVYAALSEAQNLLDALEKDGIGRTEVRLWTAHYTGKEHLCGPGCGFGLKSEADATQYNDKALGRNLDVSVCKPGFFGSKSVAV